MCEIRFTDAKMVDGGLWIKPENIAAAAQFVYGKKDKPYVAGIKELRKKRSLDANAYLWVLVSKIADILRASKEEVYFNMLKEYGQPVLIYLEGHVDPKPFLKYYEFIKDCKGAKCYKVYKGSSEMDTREMSVLIDGVVGEAQDLGIQTMTPDEIALMKARTA